MATKSLKKRVPLIRMYLVEYRNKFNYSQLDVANKINMVHSLYNQIENGKQGHLMNAEKLMALANAFNVDVKEICEAEVAYLKKYRILNGERNKE